MIRKNPKVMKRFFNILFLIGTITLVFNGCSPDVDDSEAPEIYFDGGNPMYVKLHTPYKDSLVYFDDVSGIESIWNDTTSYDPSHIGRYKVLYYARDTKGNVGSASRDFVVRIEGSTLKGRWNGTHTTPWPSGTAVNYYDSLVEPATLAVYLSRLIPGSPVKVELKSLTGDTLYIPSQVLSFTDSSQTLISGSGKVSSDGTAFHINYLLLTVHNLLTDTVNGRLDFSEHVVVSDSVN
ncbi:MAG: hypothetical protein CVU06_06210 [Bacteroidetes bacterium HGW-Bacteroidetes-22]|nr:MAG: hypothetical protein CVU06_06210 [Bacteroidetes bacterium HGW-Bacteroidetes-22]